MTDERTILKVGTALQTALEEHFPNYNKIIVPGSILTYVTTPLKVINVAFPNGGAITATISGGSTNPQVIIKVDKTATQTNQADTQSELTPRMYSAPTTNAVASIEKQRGTPVSIANTGVVGALRQTIVSDHHELPVESIANQAG